MGPKVEKIGDKCFELGEGPHWDSQTNSLFFVDIFGKSIHKYTPSNGKFTEAKFDKHVSLIVPVEGAPNKFIISLNREIVLITWDGTSSKISDVKKIAEVDSKQDVDDNRFNDGKCDPSGRLWAGTMGVEPVNGQVAPNKGSLYSLEKNNEIKTHLTPVSISNGLAWNLELKKFYYIDSPERKVFQFDFDVEKGTISNQKTIFTFDRHDIPGFPDGQAIDRDGNLWIAVFNGYRVVKIDPRRPETLLQTIDIPAKQVTSVAFGGKNLDELYVTTASFTINGEELKPPNHGALYRVTGVKAKGVDGVKVKLS